MLCQKLYSKHATATTQKKVHQQGFDADINEEAETDYEGNISQVQRTASQLHDSLLEIVSVEHLCYETIFCNIRSLMLYTRVYATYSE